MSARRPRETVDDEVIGERLSWAAEQLRIDYDTALKNGLYERLEEAGVIYHIPGTTIRRVLVAEFHRWVTDTHVERLAARPTSAQTHDRTWLLSARSR